MNIQTQEALKMAIEFMGTLTIDVGIKTWNEKHRKEAINACKEALEQPSVAQLNDEYLRDTHVDGLEQPAQEPVAWRVLLDESPEDTDWHYMTGEPWECFKQSAEPLYTHPASSWQGLSDDELFNLSQQCDLNHILGLVDYGRAVEAKLKEKNT